MPFFQYRQNNSGGSFEGPAINVIIEAPTPRVADAIAEDEGLYFNGVERGMDCPCCGDRWSTSWCEGTPEPTLYSQSIEEFLKDGYAGTWERPGIPEVLVIRADGTKEVHYTNEENRR